MLASRKTFLKFLSSFLVLLLALFALTLFFTNKNTQKNAISETSRPILYAKALSLYANNPGSKILLDARVKSDSDVLIFPKKTGKITAVYKKDGQLVYKGELIAQIENDVEVASLNRAKQAVKVAQTQLAKALSGASGKDLELAEKNLQLAEAKYSAAKLALEDSSDDLKRAAEEAMNIADEYFIYENTESAEIRVSDILSEDRVRLQNKRRALKDYYNKIEDLKSRLKFSQTTYESLRIKDEILDFANKIEDFLNDFKNSSDDALVEKPDSFLLEKIKNELILAKKVFSQSKYSFTNRAEQLNIAGKSLELAEAEYNNMKKPARDEDLKILKAKLKEANAQLELAQINYNNTKITAPNYGTLLDFDLSVGDFVSPQSPVAKTSGARQIVELYVSADIAKNIDKVYVDNKEAGFELSKYNNDFGEKKLKVYLPKKYEHAQLVQVGILLKDARKDSSENTYTIPISYITSNNGKYFVLVSDLESVSKAELDLIFLSLQNAKVKIKNLKKGYDFIISNHNDYSEHAQNYIIKLK